MGLLPSPSPAAVRCEDVFRVRPNTSAIPALSPLFTYGRRPLLDPAQFERDLALYRQALQLGLNTRVRTPTTTEAKLAFFEALGESQGHGLHLFQEVLRSASSDQARELQRAIARFNFTKGVRPSQIEQAFTRLYFLGHTDPRTWSGWTRKSFSRKRTSLITQRAELELGSHSLGEALARLGFLRDPDVRDRVSHWLRTHPLVLEAPTQAALTLLGSDFISSGRPTDLLAARPLPPELRERLLREGFEALKPELEAHYGSLPHWDLRWHYATKVFSYAVMGYVASQLAPILLNQALPPGSTDPDASYLELVRAIAAYWTGVARAQILGSSQIDPESPQAKELKDLLNDPAFDAGDIYDVNPETDSVQR